MDFPGPRRQLFKNPFSFSCYDSDTIHIVTRHPHPLGVPGYLAPFTQSSWVFYILVTILLTMPALFRLGMLRKGFFSSLQFSSLFHFEEHSKAMSKYRSGKIILFTLAMLALSFNVLYGQDLISSTVEPLLEFMPSYLNDINYRSQQVYHFFGLSHTQNIILFNFHILGTYDLQTLGNMSYERSANQGIVFVMNNIRGKIANRTYKLFRHIMR